YYELGSNYYESIEKCKRIWYINNTKVTGKGGDNDADGKHLYSEGWKVKYIKNHRNIMNIL
ncbi:MAG TPA: hypothetical protein IAC96_09450, partial [Candidatus Fimimorpha faecalis]|nr:hypothetical protein [Candidatus Fimimorpha faecalis]